MSIGAEAWLRLTEHARSMGFADIAMARAGGLPELDERRLLDVRSAVKDAGVYFPDRIRSRQLERFPWARAVVSVAWPLSPLPIEGAAGEVFRVGFLAAAFHPAGERYGPFKVAMEELRNLVEQEAGAEVRAFVDSPDICDRSAAVASGLGWWGRSGNVLTRSHGSYVLLGTMLVAASPDSQSIRSPQESRCGNCVECVRACPTGSLAQAFQCDVRSCLSLATQSPQQIAESSRAAMGARMYGCDICQEVCPVNRRIHGSISGHAAAGEGGAGSVVAGSAVAGHDLIEIIESSDDGILRRFPELYLPGRKGWLLRRNAVIALVNRNRNNDLNREVNRDVNRDGQGSGDSLRGRSVEALRRVLKEGGPVASYAQWGLEVLQAET